MPPRLKDLLVLGKDLAQEFSVGGDVDPVEAANILRASGFGVDEDIDLVELLEDIEL